MTGFREPLTQTERLNLLYRLSQAFNSSLNLAEVLNRVMDEVVAILRAERGFVVLVEEGGGLRFAAARGIEQQAIEDPQFQISRNLVERVIGSAAPVLTDDAGRDERFSMRQSVLNLGLRSILCVPLLHMSQVIGAIYVDSRLQAGIFTRDDLDLLAAIAGNAAIAVENARLYQLAVEKGRMEQELRLARDLQASLLPEEAPTLPGWQVAARWLPARQVAGDFYDFIQFPDGRLGLVIADVSDKGMAAALFMGLSRAIVRASLHAGASPAAGIAQANRLICEEARSSGMFVTLFYALLDPRSGDCLYVNAGHNPPLVYSPALAAWAPLMRTGMALGVDEEAVYTQEHLPLHAGDRLLCYTDGVIDALNRDGQDFGLPRLLEVLSGHADGSMDGLLEMILTAMQRFSTETVPFDDVTLLGVGRDGTE